MANKDLAPHLCLCLLHVDEESSSERRGHCLGSHSDRSAEADPGSSGLDALGGSRFGGRVLGRSCCSTWQSSMLSAVAAILWSSGGSHPPQCPLRGSNGAPQRSFCKQGDEVPHAWILGDPHLEDMGHEIFQAPHCSSSAHLSQSPASSWSGERITVSAISRASPSRDRPRLRLPGSRRTPKRQQDCRQAGDAKSKATVCPTAPFPQFSLGFPELFWRGRGAGAQGRMPSSFPTSRR